MCNKTNFAGKPRQYEHHHHCFPCRSQCGPCSGQAGEWTERSVGEESDRFAPRPATLLSLLVFPELIVSHDNDVELTYVHQFLADEELPHLPPGGGLASK